MKLHVLSDVHAETRTAEYTAEFLRTLKTHVKKDEPNVLVAAGDLCCFRQDRESTLELLLGSFSKMYDHVVFVPGNHEYWGSYMEDVPMQLESYRQKYGTISLTDGQIVDIDGVKFGGGTLWYGSDADGHFIDYSRIYSERQAIWNQNANWLKMDLSEVDVCVSHHMPTEESIAPKWLRYGNNEFFCAFIEEHLASFSKLPKLFIHGHTHNPMDFVGVCGSRFYCNPHGYQNEGENPEFWNRLLVEV